MFWAKLIGRAMKVATEMLQRESVGAVFHNAELLGPPQPDGSASSSNKDVAKGTLRQQWNGRLSDAEKAALKKVLAQGSTG
jgi:hypothetical protein